MQAWNIYFNGYCLDTVFYDRDCKKDYILRSLIGRGEYPNGIKIKRKNYKNNPLKAKAN